MHRLPLTPAHSVARVSSQLVEHASTTARQHPYMGFEAALHIAFKEWAANLFRMEGGDSTEDQLSWVNAVFVDLVAQGHFVFNSRI